ncbi:MAG: thioesterase domain-containing protein, partial [Rhodococcus sp. (in: high G+C Gram-positive bacteria)]|uniref:thioesterase II family protein n=1 Tax=Rhodococcus sp. TaxID=1831 RepID=UPI003BAE8678
EMRRLGGADSPAVQMVVQHPELAELVLPSLRNDYKAVETYRYRPGPDVSCPIVALRGDADPSVSEPEVRQWGSYTTGSFESREFRGGHFYLDDHSREIASLITARLR